MQTKYTQEFSSVSHAIWLRLWQSFSTTLSRLALFRWSGNRQLFVQSIKKVASTDQRELVDVVYLDFSKAFNSVCHVLLIRKMEAMGIRPKINPWVEEFLNNRTFRVKLGDHHSSAGAVKIGVPQDSVLVPVRFLIFIYDLADELTCNHLFFADNVTLRAPRRQQHYLRSSIRQAFNWSHRWYLPLNASKSRHLSKGGSSDLGIALP